MSFIRSELHCVAAVVFFGHRSEQKLLTKYCIFLRSTEYLMRRVVP
jgi:hypothetical protein